MEALSTKCSGSCRRSTDEHGSVVCYGDVRNATGNANGNVPYIGASRNGSWRYGYVAAHDAAAYDDAVANDAVTNVSTEYDAAAHVIAINHAATNAVIIANVAVASLRICAARWSLALATTSATGLPTTLRTTKNAKEYTTRVTR